MRDQEFSLRFVSPHPLLAAHVQSYWVMEHRGEMQETVRYLHPDGGSGLTWSFEGPYRVDGEFRGPGVSVRTTFLTPSEMRWGATARLVGVRFRPGGAFPLFGTSGPPEELSDADETLRLWGRLAVCSSPQDVASVLDPWLLGRCEERGWRSDLATQAVQAVLKLRGVVRVEQLAKSLDVSERHLERLFQERVGYGPKQLARIVRARHAKRRLAAGADPDVSALAFQLGYADQAHLTREFKQIIGLTPAAYRFAKFSRS